MDPERNLGEQPLAELMRKHALTPALLVRASTEQLNHKMVSRAIKGRRLTGNVMKKVLHALNAASGQSFGIQELFNYKPTGAAPGPSAAPDSSPASDDA